MPKKSYDWEAGSPPPIAAHSLAKHRILREYVETYVRVLTANPRWEHLRLSVVDGFAGGGEYVNPSGVLVPGSPLILMDAIRNAEKEVNAERRKPIAVDSRFFFVEKKKQNFDYLSATLTRRGDVGRPGVQLLHGPFDQQLDSLLASITATRSQGAARAIFVLDQYGYTDVPLTMLRRIFNVLPKAEVFLTLAVGWIAAYLPTARDAASKLGIPPHEFERVAAVCAEDIDLADPLARPTLAHVQRILYHAFSDGGAGRFVTPFFIVSRDSNRAYWFLHAANSQRASDVVKQLHWRMHNHFEHYGSAGLAMLGYDPSRDAGAQELFAFDDLALTRMRAALLDEIPRRLDARHASGVKFIDLVREVSNETPATKEQLEEVIRELVRVGELRRRTVGGNAARKSDARPQDGDILLPSRQERIIFGV